MLGEELVRLLQVLVGQSYVFPLFNLCYFLCVRRVGIHSINIDLGSFPCRGLSIWWYSRFVCILARCVIMFPRKKSWQYEGLCGSSLYDVWRLPYGGGLKQLVSRLLWKNIIGRWARKVIHLHWNSSTPFSRYGYILLLVYFYPLLVGAYP